MYYSVEEPKAENKHLASRLKKNANHGFAIILYAVRFYALIYHRLSPKDERIITKLHKRYEAES